MNASEILEELAAAGLAVGSVDELRKSGVRYVAAIPVLVAALRRSEDPREKQALVRAISVPWATKDPLAALIDEFENLPLGAGPPANNGFRGQARVTVVKPGAQVDTFGYDGGSFASPNGTPIGARSLAPGTADKPYSVFEVTNRLVVQSGKVEPWFRQPGMGTQYRLPASVGDQISAGDLRRLH